MRSSSEQPVKPGDVIMRPSYLEEGGMKRVQFGEHIVADPRICHGKLTFQGTRLFVSDVLEMVAEGMDWDAIIHECHGGICKDAIADAIRLARKALLQQQPDRIAA